MNSDLDRRESDREQRLPRNLAAIESHLRECVDVAQRGEGAFFGSDFVNRYAMYAALVQIGNAVKDLPDTFRATHPTVRWRELTHTRDRFGHIYGDRIDWDTIWAAAIDDIPVDLSAIERIREALD